MSIVRPHPSGGYTLARSFGTGSSCVYDGNFPTIQAARAADERGTWNQTWTRCDTQRWLDDKNADIVQILNLRHEEDLSRKCPHRTKSIGQWLYQHDLGAFNKAHAALSALRPDRRATVDLFKFICAISP